MNLTRRIGGKTVNVHLKPGPELEKAGREVAEHQRFAALVEEVTRSARRSARPGRSRPARRPSRRRGKGGLAARLEEVAAAEVGTLAGLAAGMLGSGAGLGVLEQAMRAALTAAGARLLEAVLAGEDGYSGPRAECGYGTRPSTRAAGTRRSPPCSARSRCAGRGITARNAATGSRPATSSWASPAARCRRAWPR